MLRLGWNPLACSFGQRAEQGARPIGNRRPAQGGKGLLLGWQTTDWCVARYTVINFSTTFNWTLDTGGYAPYVMKCATEERWNSRGTPEQTPACSVEVPVASHPAWWTGKQRILSAHLLHTNILPVNQPSHHGNASTVGRRSAWGKLKPR